MPKNSDFCCGCIQYAYIYKWVCSHNRPLVFLHLVHAYLFEGHDIQLVATVDQLQVTRLMRPEGRGDDFSLPLSIEMF